MALGEDEVNWFPSWQLSQGQQLSSPAALNPGEGLKPDTQLEKAGFYLVMLLKVAHAYYKASILLIWKRPE